MAICENCIHYELCSSISLKKIGISLIPQDECCGYKDRSRFVELPTAHWIRHTPDRSIMREFHKQGIGRGMSENSIFWTCSNCGSWGNLSFKYCPFCSAKIEEAEQALKLKERENDA